MAFEWPWALLGLLPVVALTAWALWSRRSGPELPWYRTRAPLGPVVLFAAGLALLAAAVARPVADIALPRVEGTLVIAFDNSNSMLAGDVAPSRIEVAQQIAHDLVDAQGSTIKVGVVAFSSGGVVLLEPTARHDRVRSTIDRLKPEGGTSLADGLFTALEAVVGVPIELTDDGGDAIELSDLDIGRHAGDVIVLLSDGENRRGADPIRVATLAGDAGVRVFPIGIGDAAGTTVEVDGFTIATALNEPRLASIADATGATYVHASDGAEIAAISDAIELGVAVRGERTEVTALVAAAGSFLTLLAAAWTVLRSGRVL